MRKPLCIVWAFPAIVLSYSYMRPGFLRAHARGIHLPVVVCFRPFFFLRRLLVLPFFPFLFCFFFLRPCRVTFAGCLLVDMWIVSFLFLSFSPFGSCVKKYGSVDMQVFFRRPVSLLDASSLHFHPFIDVHWINIANLQSATTIIHSALGALVVVKRISRGIAASRSSDFVTSTY